MNLNQMQYAAASAYRVLAFDLMQSKSYIINQEVCYWCFVMLFVHFHSWGRL